MFISKRQAVSSFTSLDAAFLHLGLSRSFPCLSHDKTADLPAELNYNRARISMRISYVEFNQIICA